jgi:hypothetical protein
MMRHTNVWEQLWEQLRESTEGPTVTLQVPRDVADQLLAMLASSLEVDGDDDDFDMMGDEPDGDDFGGPPDGDADDLGFGMDGGDEDGFPDLGDDTDDEPDEDDDDDDSEDDDDSDDDDEDDDDKDEAMDYSRSGGDPSGMRPETALGEGYVGFKKLKGQLSRKGGVRNPGARAASIGRKKYGPKGMASRSAAGRRK